MTTHTERLAFDSSPTPIAQNLFYGLENKAFHREEGAIELREQMTVIDGEEEAEVERAVDNSGQPFEEWGASIYLYNGNKKTTHMAFTSENPLCDFKVYTEEHCGSNLDKCFPKNSIIPCDALESIFLGGASTTIRDLNERFKQVREVAASFYASYLSYLFQTELPYVTLSNAAYYKIDTDSQVWRESRAIHYKDTRIDPYLEDFKKWDDAQGCAYFEKELKDTPKKAMTNKREAARCFNKNENGELDLSSKRWDVRLESQPEPQKPGDVIEKIEVADLNGDGRTDIVYARWLNSKAGLEMNFRTNATEEAFAKFDPLLNLEPTDYYYYSQYPALFVSAKKGETVKKGDPLLTFWSPNYGLKTIYAPADGIVTNLWTLDSSFRIDFKKVC